MAIKQGFQVFRPQFGGEKNLGKTGTSYVHGGTGIKKYKQM